MMKKPKRSSKQTSHHPPVKRLRTCKEDVDAPVGRFVTFPNELILIVIDTTHIFSRFSNLLTFLEWLQQAHTYITQFVLPTRCGSDRSKANQALLDERRDWKALYPVSSILSTTSVTTRYINKCKTEENWRKGKFSVYTFEGHTDWVRCLQFENNNLISGSADKSIKVWDMDTRECKATLTGHSRCINCLSYDNKMLASACTSVKIWNLNLAEDDNIEESSCRCTLRGHEDCVWCVQMKGNLCVSGSSDKTLRVWDVEHSTCLQVLTGHSDCVCCLQLLPYKNLVLSGSSDSTIRCYDLRAKECQSILETHSDRVWCLQCEGNTLVTGASDKAIKVWDLRTRKCTRVFSGHENSVWGLQMDGDKLVSGSADSTVRLWDMKKKTNPCENIINPNVGCVECLQFEGSRLVCGSSDSVIKMYDFSN